MVASEISKLAQKVEAVKETTELINHSKVAADVSAKITKKTVESFKNINASIEGVTGLCKEMAELSNIQAENLQKPQLSLPIYQKQFKVMQLMLRKIVLEQ